jgi:hypothetical protein
MSELDLGQSLKAGKATAEKLEVRSAACQDYSSSLIRAAKLRLTLLAPAVSCC